MNRVHALIVNQGGGIQTRCGSGAPKDGTFLYRWRPTPTSGEGMIVPITCKACKRLTKADRKPQQ